jgi:hypothetical protein
MMATIGEPLKDTVLKVTSSNKDHLAGEVGYITSRVKRRAQKTESRFIQCRADA